MSFPVTERPIDTTLAFPGLLPAQEDAPRAGSRLQSSDMISRLVNGGGANPSGTPFNPLSMIVPAFGLFGNGGFGNLAQMLMQVLQSLFSTGGQNGGGFGYGDNERYFTTANGASVGDPHLSFNGTTWDNMTAQPDLLHSDSFPGGYQISTQTTAPAANGVTYNRSATITTNYGGTNVSLDSNGDATISENGNQYNVQPGQTIDLGNGQIVQRNGDGSLVVTCDNGNGGEITTTMRDNGQGVDVSATASNVDLGGALAAAAPDPAGPSRIPQVNPVTQ